MVGIRINYSGNPFIYPCPVCGTLNQISMKRCYEICSICGWEDDEIQYDELDYEDGANPMSLNEARKMWQNGGTLYLTHPNPKRFWTDALSMLHDIYSEVVYNAWIKPIMPLSFDNKTFTLKCERDFAKVTVNQRYLSEITRCLRTSTGQDDINVLIVSPDDFTILVDDMEYIKQVLSESGKDPDAWMDIGKYQR